MSDARDATEPPETERLSKPIRCRSCDREGGRLFTAGGRPKHRCLECADETDLRCPACLGGLSARPPGVNAARCIGCRRAIAVVDGRLECDAAEPAPPAPPAPKPRPRPPPRPPDPSGIEVRETRADPGYRGRKRAEIHVRREPRDFYLDDPLVNLLAGTVGLMAAVGALLGVPWALMGMLLSLVDPSFVEPTGWSAVVGVTSATALYGIFRLGLYRHRRRLSARRLDVDDALRVGDGQLRRGDDPELPLAEVRKVRIEALGPYYRVRVDLADSQSVVALDGLRPEDAERVAAIIERSVMENRR